MNRKKVNEYLDFKLVWEDVSVRLLKLKRECSDNFDWI